MNSFPSKLLDSAVSEFAKLPGIGSKTALRLVLHLLRQPQETVFSFGNTIIEMRRDIKHCKLCNNISDNEVCTICSNASRDFTTICVVESIREILAIEKTQQYNGVYHVLGGIISPMNGIAPSDLAIDSLIQKAENGGIQEIILALSTTMEGDTTNFFLFRKLNKYAIKITTLARGVAIGDELEYTDELTLGRSLVNRTLFTV